MISYAVVEITDLRTGGYKVLRQFKKEESANIVLLELEQSYPDQNFDVEILEVEE